MTTAVQRMPALFIGHGSPLNALEHNEYTDSWRDLARSIGKPQAILVVSGHWLTHGAAVTAAARPSTFHDIGAFKQLQQVHYPAPGSPSLAARIAELLQPTEVRQHPQRGLDHGVWSILMHMYPDADVPVVQLGIDVRQPPVLHLQLARKLARLRDEGVLIIGSGNIVHNLNRMRLGDFDARYDWAERFQQQICELITNGRDNSRQLIDFPEMGPDAELAIPTADHFLPLIYTLGCRDCDDDAVEVLTPKVIFGSIGMASIAFWPSARAGNPPEP